MGNRKVMAPRKSRNRKTAERMANYKKQATPKVSSPSEARTRRSPRAMKLDDARKKALENSTPGTPIATRSLNESLHNNEEKETDDVDMDMFVPETPEPAPLVVGRKRALVSHPLDLRLAENGCNKEVSGSPDSTVPSKKRKEFHTPPRPDVRSDERDDRRAQGEEHGQMGWSREAASKPAQPESTTEYDPTMMRSLWNEPEPVLDGSGDDGVFSPLSFSQVTQEKSKSKHGGSKDTWTHVQSVRSRRPDSVKQNSHPVAFQDLDVITSFSESLSRHLGVFKRNIEDNMSGLHREQLSEMRELHESFAGTIMSEIQDMKAVLDSPVSRSSRPSSGKVVSKISIACWEKKLDDLTPHAKLIFNRDVFARILSYNFPVKARDVYDSVLNTEGISSHLLAASTAVHSLIFSLQPKEKKKHFSEGVGRLHSEFKYSVVQNVFYNVCKDTFDLFRSSLVPSDNSGDGSDVSKTNQDGKNRITRPEWLDTGYVSIPHIDNARALVESLKQSRKNKVGFTPSPDDIASHGALRVYRLLGAHLHDGREYVRYAFFQSLGYLFVQWKDYVSDTDQSTLEMRFQEDTDLELRMDEIPDTELCSIFANRNRSELVDAANMKLLKRLFVQYPGLVLEVQHEVHVVSSTGSQRRHSGGEKRILRKYVNLIEVACDVIVELTRVKNAGLFLRTQKDALKCVMMSAVVFREMSAAFMDQRRSTASVMPKTEDIKVYGITLKDLIPGPNCQGSVLESRCLRLTDTEFEKFNQQEELPEVRDREEAERTFHMSRIQESVMMGVAMI